MAMHMCVCVAKVAFQMPSCHRNTANDSATQQQQQQQLARWASFALPFALLGLSQV
jgi:hypothetical protein